MRRLIAIGFIWFGCALAWLVLGSTIVFRSGEKSGALQQEVRLLWGPAIVQAPPVAVVDAPPDAAPAPAAPAPEQVPSEQGARAEPATEQPTAAPLPLALPVDASDIDVALALEHRKKGLLWFSTYTVDFEGSYTFVNPGDQARRLVMSFPLAGDGAVYDAFKVLDADGKPVDATVEGGRAEWRRPFGAGERASYTIVYKSRGTSSWTYAPAAETAARVKNFALRLSVDTADIDFPAGTLSPTTHALADGGWQGAWTFDSLVTSSPIGVDLPKRLNPGPLASQITFFAPVSLLFFFFVVAVLAAARRKNLHPMHYFLLGCAFFAFHLLFAYLVDHLSVMPAFATAALVSVGLVVSYARLFVGWRFALCEMGVAQLLYLVLFSFSFFWTGFTGLAVTVGAIVTLFVIMQITGRIDWHRAVRDALPRGASLASGADSSVPAR
jgi:hypothetical protein